MEPVVTEIIKALSGHERCHICDVGANPIGGSAPYEKMLSLQLADITGFEPQPDALEQLLRKKSQNETYLPTAVGDGSAKDLRIFSGSGFASFFDIDPETVHTLAPLKQYTKLLKKIPCKTSRLDDIKAVRPIDFLKIDVQGSELSILQNAKSKLSNAVAIQTEVRFFPLYIDEPTFGDLDSELRGQGFQLHNFTGLKIFKFNTPYTKTIRRKHKRQLLDGDAVYIRDVRKIHSFSESQLQHLGQLALLVFEATDLAVLAISELERRNQFDRNLLEEFVASL